MTFLCPVATALPEDPTTNSPNNNNNESDGQISTSDANVGLIVGLTIAILVIMSLVIAMVTIAAVALKKHEKIKDLSSSRAISNITYYGTKGQSSKIIIIMIANEINCTVIRHRIFRMIDLVSLSIIYYFLKQ